MSVLGWVTVGGAIIAASILIPLLISRPLMRALRRDPFHAVGLQSSAVRLARVQLALPEGLTFKPGLEGQSHYCRFRVVSEHECLFVPRHLWVFQDEGRTLWPVAGVLTMTDRYLEAIAQAPLLQALSSWCLAFPVRSTLRAEALDVVQHMRH